MLIPPAGVVAETHLDSKGLAESIGALAQKYPDDEGIQIYAAERFAAAGESEQSEQLLKSLEASSENSASNVAIARAKIKATQGQFRDAYDSLTELAKTDASNDERLLRMAAGYATRVRGSRAGVSCT